MEEMKIDSTNKIGILKEEMEGVIPLTPEEEAQEKFDTDQIQKIGIFSEEKEKEILESEAMISKDIVA